MSKPTEKFLDLITKARDVSFIVAEALAQRGHRVRVIPNTVRPSFAERWEHTDSGDLEVTLRVEVKHVRINFHSRESFPYDSLIVDEAYKVEKQHELPLYGYAQVNASLTGCLIIPMWTRDAWYKEHRFDKQENARRLFYFCPKDRTHYLPLKRAAVSDAENAA